MGTLEEVDILDNKQVGQCLEKINNCIIKMRLKVKKGKHWSINELSRKIKRINKEETRNEDRKKLKQRKLSRLEEEVTEIKKLECDLIALYALENVATEDFMKLMGSDPPVNKRAKARVAHTTFVKQAVEVFQESFPEYPRYITLYAARKEKGIGAKKHGKGKKMIKTEERSEESVTDKLNADLKVQPKKKEKFSKNEPASKGDEPKSFNGPKATAKKQDSDNPTHDGANSDSDSDVIEFDHHMSDEDGEAESDKDGEDEEGDNSDSEKEAVADDLKVDGKDPEGHRTDVINSKPVKYPNSTPSKDSATSSLRDKKKPLVERSRTMVVTRLNLEEMDSEVVTLSQDRQDVGEQLEDDAQAVATHEVDPFFGGGGQKRTHDEDESSDESDDDNVNLKRKGSHHNNGGGQMESEFVGLSRGQRGNVFRGRGGDRGGRGSDRGGGGRGRGNDRGNSGRGGDRGNRGAFNNDRGSNSGFNRGGRGGERSNRGGDRGGRGSFTPFETPKEDVKNLHPSWQAKKKQKVQISSVLASQGKKITFD